MGSEGRRETLIIVNPAAHNVPSRKRLGEGRGGDRYFLLMAGYGLDGAIARRVHPGLKSRLGAATYAIAAVREALRYRSSPVTLRFDGEERDADVLMLVAGDTA